MLLYCLVKIKINEKLKKIVKKVENFWEIPLKGFFSSFVFYLTGGVFLLERAFIEIHGVALGKLFVNRVCTLALKVGIGYTDNNLNAEVFYVPRFIPALCLFAGAALLSVRPCVLPLAPAYLAMLAGTPCRTRSKATRTER